MRQPKSYDVVGIGCCAFDIVAEVERYPGRDDKVPVRSIRTQGGGLTATALVAVARLGGTCAYLGTLGDDYFAQFCVDDFGREGVETRYVRRVPGASVVTAIIVACPQTGTRMILVNTRDNPPALAGDAVEEVIRRGRVLHVDNFQPAAALAGARLARAHGVPVTMDLESAGPGTEDFLALGDYVIVPLHFTQARYGAEALADGARALYEELVRHGGRVAVVTGGTAGSHAVWTGGSLHQPAYQVPVVDTTGCGDVYHGAFALGLARGWALERIMAFASAVAALKCRKLGGRAGIPTGPEVDEFLKSARPIDGGA
jgi:sugar/nucleoside kinase (ribokinase family)